MPTVAAFIATLQTAIEAELDAVDSGAWKKQDHDYTNDLEGFTSSNYILYSTRVSVAGITPDSNVTYEIAECEFTVAWDLTRYPAQALKTAEETLTDSDLQTLCSTFIKPSWWRALSGVNDVEAVPARVVEREGNVLTLDVAAQVSINPA